MAILKKKMAGKPVMKKAKEGDKVPPTKNPGVFVKNAVKDTLQSNVGGKSPELSEVKVKSRGNAFTTAAKSTRNFLKEDFFGAKDSTRTKAGKIVRKVANTAVKTAYAPVVAGANLIGASMSRLMGKNKITAKDKADGRLYYSNDKERAAQKATSDSTNAVKKKMGGMIKRADGSKSQHGLWDSIRENKGSGKKPTTQMLKQEKKIKAKKAKDGTSVAKSDTSRYNKKTDTQEINKPLDDVAVRPSFGQNFKSNMRNFMTTDSTDFPKERAKIKSTSNDTRKFGDNAQAKSNLRQRKQFSTAARVISAPVAAATSALGAGVDAVRNKIKNKQDLNKISKQKMGGKVAPKMMMKKMSKKK